MRYFVKASQIDQNILSLDSDSFHYLSRVCRLKKGEVLSLIVDEQFEWNIKVVDLKKNQLFFVAPAHQKKISLEKPTLTLVQCLPKQDKFSDILDCCAQIGVSTFYPIKSDRTICAYSEKQTASRYQRWLKKRDQVSIQAKLLQKPALKKMMSLKDYLDRPKDTGSILKLVCWEEVDGQRYSIRDRVHSAPFYDEIIVLIGPEGGLSKKEVLACISTGFQVVSLGSTILKVEVAGFYAFAQCKS